MASKSTVEATQQARAAMEKHPTGQTLYVGWASADITPQQPVALVGQMRKRISQSVLDPLTATVLALETRGQNTKPEQAIMVSCDVAFINKPIQERLRVLIKHKLPDFDTD
ncbi:MAG: hypothetical protein ACYS8I_02890, partial [Planctomycetota bacterium]